jgi:hypothetical protein
MTLAAPVTTRWDLSGRYQHPHWLAHVCSGLTDRGISVMAGRAARRAAGEWDAHLDVDLSGAVVPTLPEDVHALAAPTRRRNDRVELRLASVRLARLADGFLALDVTAPDELGFLGRLLRRVSLLSLYPVEVQVATHGGTVHDRLVLAGIGSSRPSEDIGEVLEQVLRGHLVR